MIIKGAKRGWIQPQIFFYLDTHSLVQRVKEQNINF